MADIFLSYAREDREKARVLAEALEGLGWSVFWDLTIPAGESWDTYIGGELEKARCIVVAWSSRAVDSEWVREEAREGRERKIMVPAYFEDVKPPFGFRGVQGADLSAWHGEADPRFLFLVAGLERVLGPPPIQAGLTKDARPPVQQDTERAADARRGRGAPTWTEDQKLNRRILIEGGEFLMGSPEGVGRPDQHPQHRVRLPPFYLQEHPATNEEFLRFKPGHGFARGEEDHPAVNVTWEDAVAYAGWLGGRLPTEAEWEYACRAGTRMRYWSGDSERDLALVGWYQANSKGRAHRVGKKPANPWGLYDMHGNVWEWVADWFGPYPRELQVEPLNAESSSGLRVGRGGSFVLSAASARSASRGKGPPDNRHHDLGFRVAFPATQTA